MRKRIIIISASLVVIAVAAISVILLLKNRGLIGNESDDFSNSLVHVEYLGTAYDVMPVEQEDGSYEIWLYKNKEFDSKLEDRNGYFIKNKDISAMTMPVTSGAVDITSFERISDNIYSTSLQGASRYLNYLKEEEGLGQLLCARTRNFIEYIFGNDDGLVRVIVTDKYTVVYPIDEIPEFNISDYEFN